MRKHIGEQVAYAPMDILSAQCIYIDERIIKRYMKNGGEEDSGQVELELD